MEINGLINYPPVSSSSAASAGASSSARFNATIKEMATQPSAFAQAAKATRDAVEASSTGDNDAADGVRQAIVALAAAIGSPVSAQIASSAARRSAPIKINYPDPPAPKEEPKLDPKETTHNNTQPVVVHTAPAHSAPAPEHVAKTVHYAPPSVETKSKVSVYA